MFGMLQRETTKKAKHVGGPIRKDAYVQTMVARFFLGLPDLSRAEGQGSSFETGRHRSCLLALAMKPTKALEGCGSCFRLSPHHLMHARKAPLGHPKFSRSTALACRANQTGELASQQKRTASVATLGGKMTMRVALAAFAGRKKLSW